MSDFVLVGIGFVCGALVVGIGAYAMIVRAFRHR